MRGPTSRHLAPSDTVGDILRHPAFAGFAPSILPSDGRAYDERLRIDQIGSLLPYHSHVSPQDVVGGLNRLIDDVSEGKAVFYRFYSEAEMRSDPSRAYAGLFFFRGRPGAPFAMVAPGGGFAYVGSLHEGFPYALDINTAGHNAFVLKYRSGMGGDVATRDLAAALSFVFAHATELGVSTRNYSVWGSSAGARMAAAIGTHGVAAFGGTDVEKPAAVVMAYTAHAELGTAEPPTFAVVGEADGIAPPAAMRRRVEALRKSGAAVEYRVFGNVGHGFGRGTGTSADGWIAEAVRFWERSSK